jgi:hypothetical protein
MAALSARAEAAEATRSDVNSEAAMITYSDAAYTGKDAAKL